MFVDAPVHLPGVLILLVGPPGAGKTTFAEAVVHAGLADRDAVVSCDVIKAGMFGEGADGDHVDAAVFARMDELVRHRLSQRLPTIVDATNVTSQARLRMIAWAAEYSNPVWVARFTASLKTVLAQNAGRAKVLPTEFVTEYAAIMAEQATDGHLTSEGASRIIDIRGLQDGVTPNGAVRLAFPEYFS